MPDPVLEALSSKLHDIYQQEAQRQGNLRHPNAYDALAEPVKEYDRVLTRWILKYASPDMVRAMLSDPLTEEVP